MQDNLKEKYGITDEELKRAVDFVIWFATAIYNRQKKSKPTNEPL